MRMGLAALAAIVVAGAPALAQKPAVSPMLAAPQKSAPVTAAQMQMRMSLMSTKVAMGIFKAADVNRDGRISKAEMDAYARRSGVKEGIDPKAWARTDVNHDGYATLPELTSAISYSLRPEAKPGDNARAAAAAARK